MIPTMTTSSYLYLCNRNREIWEHELEKHKAFRYIIGITICIAVIVYAWILRP